MRVVNMKKSNIAAALVAAFGIGGGINAHAAGFQLFEQGVSGLGTAYAAGAAVEDASTIYWNPAGMTYLQGKSLSGGLHLIKPAAEFDNNGSRFENPPLAGAPVTGGNGGDAGGVAPVPNFFYSHALNDRMRLGVGFSSVYGLKTEYDDDWVGRYHAITSDLRTININPSFAYRVDDVLSLGGGVNIVKADVELSNALNFGLIGALQAINSGLVPAPAIPTLLNNTNQRLDGKVTLKGDDIAYGWNFGMLFQPKPAFRFGFSYRSKVKVAVEGNARFSIPDLTSISPLIDAGVRASPQFANDKVKAEVALPEIASLNAYYQLNDRVALMGDATWTNWSRFRELRIKFANGRPDSVTPENWDDSYKISFGAHFKLNEKWLLRGGVAYDKSPVDDAFRTPRIPDADRTWLAFGARYNLSDHNSIDVGFAHIFVDDPELDKVSDEGLAQLHTRLIGEYKSDVNILSIGYNHRF
jgi:long-chain fatty acid transport protein